MLKQRYDSFDCLKGIACLAVVLIHFNFPGELGLSVKAFCRFGVPVFLFISGFFFLKDGEINDAAIVKKIRHTFSLILFSGLFYAIFTPIINTPTINGWNIKVFVANLFTPEKIAKFFITNDPFVYSHLWFLMALLYSYIFSLLFFNKKSKLGVLKYLAPILLVAYTCMQEFGAVFKVTNSFLLSGTNTSIWLYNLFLFRALPFFLFGILCSMKKDYIKNLPINNIVLGSLAIVGGVIAIFERHCFSEAQFYIGNYLTVAAMFVYAIKFPDTNVKILKHLGRDLSLYVYILHIAIAKCMDLIFKAIIDSSFYSYSKCFFVLLVSILIAEIIYFCKKTLFASNQNLA